MKSLNYQTGKVGEEIAKKYLEEKGYQIIQNNFRTRIGEIDLITTKDQKLIFVEVKLKIGDNYGTPEEMINHHKLQQVQNTAQYYLQDNPDIAKQYPSYQIESVCIVLNLDQTVKRINHYEMA